MANITVFISYSRKDEEFAERIKVDLRQSGASIWIDHESLEPGTPDWQAAIRRGIEAATALVYIGSPDAAQSLNVRAEVVIATEEHLRIIPIWAKGETWSKCAPFELIGANFLDAHTGAYTSTIARLRDSLGLPTPLPTQTTSPAITPHTGSSPVIRRLQALQLRKLDGDSFVRSVSWSPDGSFLASGGHRYPGGLASLLNISSPPGIVQVWNADSGQLVATLRGHRDEVNSVAWAPDGSRLASASGRSYKSKNDNTVRIWNPTSGQLLAILKGHRKAVHSVSWSPDGSRLASIGEDRGVRIWDPVSAQPVITLDGGNSYYGAVAWSPDGSRIAFTDVDNLVRIFDPVSAQRLTTLSGHFGWIQKVAWSPDGSRIATGSHDHTITLWDPVTGQAQATLMGHRDRVSSVAWSRDGEFLASTSSDRTVRIWDSISGQSLATLEPYTNGFSSMECAVWSPKDSRLACGGNGPIHILEIAEG